MHKLTVRLTKFVHIRMEKTSYYLRECDPDSLEY